MQKTLEKIVAHIVYLVQPELVMLFGSVADGRSNVYSDVDLLIIMETAADKLYLAKQIQSFAREFSIQADVLIYSRAELDQASLEPFSFLTAIKENGKIIYQKRH